MAHSCHKDGLFLFLADQDKRHRRSSDASESGTGGTRSALSEDDAPEVWGECIDEDMASVGPSNTGDGGDSGEHTNSSLRLMRWLRDYGEIMRCGGLSQMALINISKSSRAAKPVMLRAARVCTRSASTYCMHVMLAPHQVCSRQNGLAFLQLPCFGLSNHS